MTVEEIKRNHPMSEVVEGYGYRIGQDGFIRCPFHKEKTASMMIYEDSFYCFGCGAGGDIFTFVQKMDNCSFKDAFYKLGGVYDHTESKMDKIHRIRDIKLEEQKRQRELAKKKQELKELSNEVNLLVTAKRELEPLSDEWCYVCKKLPVIFDQWESLWKEVSQTVRQNRESDSGTVNIS